MLVESDEGSGLVLVLVLELLELVELCVEDEEGALLPVELVPIVVPTVSPLPAL